MLSRLKSAEAEFMIVGAYALAAHGFPRATGDIDILISNSPQNAQKVMRALTKFGAAIADFSEQDFTAADMIMLIGVEPCRIDLITSIDGVTFEEAWPNRVNIEIDGLEIDILSKADLLKNKLAAGRDKDQGDIAWLKSQRQMDS
jgi:predicted nucleotidyltransferase